MKIFRQDLVRFTTELNSEIARILRDLADGADIQDVVNSSAWFSKLVREDFDMEDGEIFEPADTENPDDNEEDIDDDEIWIEKLSRVMNLSPQMLDKIFSEILPFDFLCSYKMPKNFLNEALDNASELDATKISSFEQKLRDGAQIHDHLWITSIKKTIVRRVARACEFTETNSPKLTTPLSKLIIITSIILFSEKCFESVRRSVVPTTCEIDWMENWIEVAILCALLEDGKNDILNTLYDLKIRVHRRDLFCVY